LKIEKNFKNKTHSAKDSMIRLEGVSISFLEIPQGESFVIVGPSGEGKSVLLKLMAGVLEPTSGKVWIDNLDLNGVRGHEREELQQRMGMLFQKNALFDSLKVGENIAFPLAEGTDLSAEEIDKKVDFFLEAVDLSHAKKLFPDEISGGMQKRLGIARALALNPEIIYYDDPTAGLDPITSRKIIDLILTLREENNSTVVAITNEINRAYQMADRIGMVIDQELVVTGNVKSTKKSQDPRVQQFIRGDLEGPLTVTE
jgi:phospholipid/cholesterol/gamma-HCH transport system ATP-binding protein